MLKDSLNQEVKLRDILVLATDRVRAIDFVYVIESRDDGYIRVAPFCTSTEYGELRLHGGCNKRWMPPSRFLNIMSNLRVVQPELIDKVETEYGSLVVTALNNVKKPLYCVFNLDDEFYCAHANEYTVARSETCILNLIKGLHQQKHGTSRSPRSLSVLNRDLIAACNEPPCIFFEAGSWYSVSNSLLTHSQFKRIFGYLKEGSGMEVLLSSDLDMLTAWFKLKSNDNVGELTDREVLSIQRL